MGVKCLSLAMSLKNKISNIIFIIVVVLYPTPATIAQNNSCIRQSCKGNDFWVTFLCNDDDPANSLLSVIATGAQQASVTVTNPVNGWTQTSNMPAGDKIQISLPTPSTIPSGQPYNIGYHITSTAPITLYASNFKEGSLDFALILPTYAISDNYIVQNYPNNSDHPANIAIVATEDSTELSMILPCVVTNLGLPVGSPFSVTLNAGESIMMRANQGGHFSGMEITSNCKPFVLFQGCAAGRVGDNSNNTGRDHFMEQSLPPAMWGTEFVADASLSRNEGDRILITAGVDNCTVQINESIVATLMRGQSYEHTLSVNTTAHIITSQPAYACLYLMSYRNGGSLGDPGAATLPPVDRWVCHSDFMLHQNSNNPSVVHYISNPYINIIADNSAIGSLTLDGSIIPTSQFSAINGTPYSHVRMHLDYGAHTLDAAGTGFFEARAYGLGSWSGFTYNIDMLVDSMERCLPEIRRDTTTYLDTVCQGYGYSGHGFNVNTEETETPNTLIRMDSIVVGDTIIHYQQLTLTILPNSSYDIYTTLFTGDTLYFLDTIITTEGDYSFTISSVNGCDSVITLHIKHQSVGFEYNSIQGCPGQEIMLSASGTHLFRWSSTPYDPELDSLQGTNPITVHPKTTTTYHILDDSGNIISSVTVHVTPPPALCIETNRDFIDFDDPIITLHDCSSNQHISTWIFSDGYTISGKHTFRQFQHPLPDSVTVTLHSCNKNNCCIDTTILIHKEIRSIWFPNILTPSEPPNHLFGPYTSCQVAEFEILLFNRWGLLVWHSTDINDTWDGTHNGTPVPQSSYVYRWYLKDIHGKEWNGTGMVSLVR